MMPNEQRQAEEGAKMARLVHFDMQADDPERAIQFYEGVLGWKLQQWEGPMEYWLVETGPTEEPGINGGLSRRPEGAAVPDSAATATFTCTVDVPSVDAAAAAVEARGAITRPKVAVPGVGWLVYCRDTEGNDFGMMEADSSAA